MPETQKLRLRTPADILDALPTLLGYSPIGSLVAIPLSGKRSGVVLRFDLPSPSHDPHDFADQVMGYLAGLSGIDRVAFIFAGDEELAIYAGRTGEAVPYQELSRAIDKRAEFAGIEPVISIWRTLDFWGPLGCGEESCCPMVEPTPTADRAPWPANTTTAERLALTKIAPDEMATFASELNRREAILRDENHPDLLAAIHQLHTLELSDPSTAELVTLTLRLRNEESTSDLLSEIAFGDPRAASITEATTNCMTQMDLADRFDRRRVQHAERVLRHLLAHFAPDDTDRVNTLTALAWLAWSRGQGSFTHEYLEQIAAVQDLGTDITQRLRIAVHASAVPLWLGANQSWQGPGAKTSDKEIPHV